MIMSVFSKIALPDRPRPRVGLCAAVLGLSTLVTLPAHAASPLGVWLTPADRNGQVAHIVAQQCGLYYCGTIARVFDQSGTQIAAPTVGQTVFWNMAADGDGYRGRAYVPAHKREYAAEMHVDGNRMTVSGCLGPICQSQVWQRVN